MSYCKPMRWVFIGGKKYTLPEMQDVLFFFTELRVIVRKFTRMEVIGHPTAKAQWDALAQVPDASYCKPMRWVFTGGKNTLPEMEDVLFSCAFLPQA